MRYRPLTRYRWPFCGAVAACLSWYLVAGLLSVGTAQEKPPDEKTELAKFLDDAQHYTIRTTKPETVLKLQESPLLNFTNPERNQERGSVFLWLNDGRPAAMGQFFRYDARKGRVEKHALHSLAAGPIEAKYHDKLAWAPEQPGVEWKSFPDAPAVAATSKKRILQMRQISRAFRLNLFDPKFPEKPIELRLAPHPLFEYSALGAGVTDGAIFSYLVATDPEAILLVEAFDEAGKTGFRYAFARFTFWRLTATLGDKSVWEAEFDPSMMNNTFAKPETIKKVYNSYVP